MARRKRHGIGAPASTTRSRSQKLSTKIDLAALKKCVASFEAIASDAAEVQRANGNSPCLGRALQSPRSNGFKPARSATSRHLFSGFAPSATCPGTTPYSRRNQFNGSFRSSHRSVRAIAVARVNVSISLNAAMPSATCPGTTPHSRRNQFNGSLLSSRRCDLPRNNSGTRLLLFLRAGAMFGGDVR